MCNKSESALSGIMGSYLRLRYLQELCVLGFYSRSFAIVTLEIQAGPCHEHGHFLRLHSMLDRGYPIRLLVSFQPIKNNVFQEDRNAELKQGPQYSTVTLLHKVLIQSRCLFLSVYPLFVTSERKKRESIS